ncbi:MAG: 30S ribosomal protein S19 [bacterium]|nr:30S ribosomal protein S19 [bacterium]
MPREFTYRGYTLEQLKQLPLEEFAKLLKARARRHLLRILRWWKTAYNPKDNLQKSNEIIKVYEKALKAAKELEQGKNPKPIRTHRRDVVILPFMVGLTFEVYNGKEFQRIKIAPEMLGHRLGEFVFTRKEVVHSAPGLATKEAMKKG